MWTITGLGARSLTANTAADTDLSESLSSWSATTEGGHHEEDAHWQCQGEARADLRLRRGIPYLEHSKPRSYASSAPRTPGLGNSDAPSLNDFKIVQCYSVDLFETCHSPTLQREIDHTFQRGQAKVANKRGHLQESIAGSGHTEP